MVTKKDAGLSVYDLARRELQAVTPPPAPGPDDAAERFNNVDLVYGFRVVGRRRGPDHLLRPRPARPPARLQPG